MHLREQVTQPSDPSYRIIPLTRGQVTLVDTADFEWLNQWDWSAVWMPNAQSYYVDRHAPTEPSGRRPHILMHRLIMGVTDSKIKVDHRDKDTLNHRRYNLRVATNAENCRNSRARNKRGNPKGVHWAPDRKKWRACICVDYKLIHLGGFGSQEEAVAAYAEAALKYHGEFASYTLPPAPAQQGV